MDGIDMESGKKYLQESSKYLKAGGKLLLEEGRQFLEEGRQFLEEGIQRVTGELQDSHGEGGKNYALITGASSGIGREFARQLSLEGHPLILVARRRDRLETLRAELGTECLLLPADLARRDDLIRLCEDLVGRRIDVFINNAGFGVSGPLRASASAAPSWARTSCGRST